MPLNASVIEGFADAAMRQDSPAPKGFGPKPPIASWQDLPKCQSALSLALRTARF